MRQRAMVGLVVLSIIVLAGCTGGYQTAPDTASQVFSFEEGLEGWSVGTDLPDDPNRDSGKVNHSVSTTGMVAAEGNRSLAIGIDGSQDDGTVWVQRDIPVEPGYRYNVTLAVSAFSEDESFNTRAHIVTYAGIDEPQNESSFPQADAVVREGRFGGLRKPLSQQAGWKRYTVTWATPDVEQDHITVAAGMSVVWETGILYRFDAVEVTAEPLQP